MNSSLPIRYPSLNFRYFMPPSSFRSSSFLFTFNAKNQLRFLRDCFKCHRKSLRNYLLSFRTEYRTRRNASDTGWRQPRMYLLRFIRHLPSMRFIWQPCLRLHCHLTTLGIIFQETSSIGPHWAAELDTYNRAIFLQLHGIPKTHLGTRFLSTSKTAVNKPDCNPIEQYLLTSGGGVSRVYRPDLFQQAAVTGGGVNFDVLLELRCDWG